MRQIKILYFASLADTLGTDHEQLVLEDSITSIAGLRNFLFNRGDKWQNAFSSSNLKCALNQNLATDGEGISDGDEVAFFPPVTGG